MTSARTRRIARFSLAGVLATVLAAGLAVALLSITPPRPVARRILLTISDRVLFAPDETQRARYAVHKVLGMYLEYMIAGKMARTAAARSDLHDDVARIAYVLSRANVRMISADEIPHSSQDWPVLVAGVGYCDQVNAAVCRILAHSFPRAQLFALHDPATGASPHTIGRVWSNERKEWLYFDAFYAQVVFRRTAGGGIEILSNVDNGPNAEVLSYYRLGGWVMSEYPSTFPAFLANSICKRRRSAPTPEEQPPQTASAPALPVTPAPTTPVQPVNVVSLPVPDEAASRRVAQTYVRARADDLFGDPNDAKKGYRLVAAATEELDPTVKILQAAAQRFGQ
jgi:hypothetical protein